MAQAHYEEDASEASDPLSAVVESVETGLVRVGSEPLHLNKDETKSGKFQSYSETLSGGKDSDSPSPSSRASSKLNCGSGPDKAAGDRPVQKLGGEERSSPEASRVTSHRTCSNQVPRHGSARNEEKTQSQIEGDVAPSLSGTGDTDPTTGSSISRRGSKSQQQKTSRGGFASAPRTESGPRRGGLQRQDSGVPAPKGPDKSFLDFITSTKDEKNEEETSPSPVLSAEEAFNKSQPSSNASQEKVSGMSAESAFNETNPSSKCLLEKLWNDN